MNSILLNEDGPALRHVGEVTRTTSGFETWETDDGLHPEENSIESLDMTASHTNNSKKPWDFSCPPATNEIHSREPDPTCVTQATTRTARRRSEASCCLSREKLHLLLASLREELMQYGEMLSLLDSDQGTAPTSAAVGYERQPEAVQNQREAIRRARAYRTECLHEIKRSLGLEETIGPAELVLHLPPAYQPLVQALIEEDGTLASRIRQKLRYVLSSRPSNKGARRGNFAREHTGLRQCASAETTAL